MLALFLFMWLISASNASAVNKMIYRANRKATILSHQQRSVDAKVASIKRAAAAARRHPEVQECSDTGECKRLGVSVALHDGMGMVWCKDCANPEAAGAYGELCVNHAFLSRCHP